MVTKPTTRHPFEPIRAGFDYRALWEANLAWGIIALTLVLLSLAIWAFMASDWYQPAVEAPIDVPAVQHQANPQTGSGAQLTSGAQFTAVTAPRVQP